ncbi:hypothetical protein Tco_1110395 [Tanacetum coccineum]|uniref:Uncharacterized protein n=1 Tax=Tanacetum coccineum TaxID=301880 RepID=A0ABQ5IIR7_9ASTR
MRQQRPAGQLGCSVARLRGRRSTSRTAGGLCRAAGCCWSATQNSHPNPLTKNYEKRNKQGTIEYHVQPVKNANLKWRELPSMERHAYSERLSKLQGKGFGTPNDGDVFMDYSWERALSFSGDVYPEWCLEFFSTMYFDKGVDRTKLMTEKCIWFRLCVIEKVLTLLEFAVLLGLYEEEELNHRLFDIHFTRLEVDDKLFNHEAFWQKIGTLTSTNPRTSLIKEPLMRIVHRLLVIAEHLSKHALGLKENILICGDHYVTKISSSLGYLVDEKVMKCSELIECEKWTSKMLVNELDEDTHALMQTRRVALQPSQARWQRQEPSGLDSSWGDWNTYSNEIERRDVWRDSMLMRNNYILEHSAPILHHLADQYNFAYPAYEPPNVPPYPYSYVPYPHPYTHYPVAGNQSYGGEQYGARGDGYYACSIVSSSGYKIGGSSIGFHGDNDLIPIGASRMIDVASDYDEKVEYMRD